MVGRESVFAVIGVAATALGVLLLFEPSLVTVGPVEWLVRLLEARSTDQVLLVMGVTIIGYLTIGLRSQPDKGTKTDAMRQFERATESPPESVTTAEQAVTAQALDGDIEIAIERGGKALAVVRADLRTVAINMIADVRGLSTAQATAIVDSGEWCQEPVASEFLAEQRSSTVGQKLRLLLFPNRVRREQIERTIAAIERVGDQ